MNRFRRLRRELPFYVTCALVGLALGALLVGGVWIRTSAPCSWWSWQPVKDVPARCLMHR